MNYIISDNNLHIFDSCKASRKEMICFLGAIAECHPLIPLWQHRSVEGMMKEWTVHNACYNLGLLRKRTKDVDLNDPQPWFVKAAYTLVYPFACLITK